MAAPRRPLKSVDSISNAEFKRRFGEGLNVRYGLGQVIANANEARLRKVLKTLVLVIPAARKLAEESMMVELKDVVPYHADSASEDASESEDSQLEDEESEESDGGDDESDAAELVAPGGKIITLI